MSESTGAARRATLSEIASLAGVSSTTASNVLIHPERVAPSTAARVHAAVAEVGYIPNDSARRLRGSARKQALVVMLDLTDATYRAVARGIEAEAIERNIFVLFAGFSAVGRRILVQGLASRQVPAIGLVSSHELRSSEEIHVVEDRGITVVRIDAASRLADPVAVGRAAVRRVVRAHDLRPAPVGHPGPSR